MVIPSRVHSCLFSSQYPKRDLFQPLRSWLDRFEIRHRKVAHLICRLIPKSCPFERDINLWRYTFHIPALCKLNPLYPELINLRFRALSYLADVCQQDISIYIC
ncbi:MAG TPA: Mo-dependent nitrogenase C-terminal domain-containing protein [Allocoleopsis sp.]